MQLFLSLGQTKMLNYSKNFECIFLHIWLDSGPCDEHGPFLGYMERFCEQVRWRDVEGTLLHVERYIWVLLPLMKFSLKWKTIWLTCWQIALPFTYMITHLNAELADKLTIFLFPQLTLRRKIETLSDLKAAAKCVWKNDRLLFSF